MDAVDLYEVTIVVPQELHDLFGGPVVVHRAREISVTPTGDLVLLGDADSISLSPAWESFSVTKLKPRLN